MNLDIILMATCIPILLTSIIAYFTLKRLRKEAISILNEIVFSQKDLLKDDLEKWLNSEVGQKALYGIGALIGSGAMSGTGLQKGSGKMKWQDLAIQVAASFIQSKVPLLSTGSQGLNAETTQNKVPEAK